MNSLGEAHIHTSKLDYELAHTYIVRNQQKERSVYRTMVYTYVQKHIREVSHTRDIQYA